MFNNKIFGWIITSCFVVIAICNVYIAIELVEIVDRLEIIAEFIGNTGS